MPEQPLIATNEEKYLMRFGVPPPKIVPVPYCAKIATHLSLPLKRDASVARRLIYVGQLITLKGLALFLTTLSDGCETTLTRAVNSGSLEMDPHEVNSNGFRKPANSDLSFLGSVAYEKLPELYGQGGIVVFQ